MENTSQFDELIIKYLLKETNTEEEAQVTGWINDNEQNRQYFEELKRTWKLTAVKKEMEKVDVEQEWDQFKQSVDGKGAKVVPLNEYSREENDPLYEEKPAGRSIVYRLLIGAAIAASVLFIIGLGFGWFSDKTEAPAVANTNAGTQKDSLLASVHHERNRSGKPKQFTLQDGTVVTLDNNSELTYPEPFAGNKRDITLTGKAAFKVAKDKTKPFTVNNGLGNYALPNL